MAHPYHHAQSSAKRFGGGPESYIHIHNWFDASKSGFADFRHRAMRHHSEGIFECEKIFGVTISVSTPEGIVQVPVRLVGEQHVKEDLGWIPSMKDWLVNIKREPWMNGAAFRGIEREEAKESIPLTKPPVEGKHSECKSLESTQELQKPQSSSTRERAGSTLQRRSRTKRRQRS